MIQGSDIVMLGDLLAVPLNNLSRDNCGPFNPEIQHPITNKMRTAPSIVHGAKVALQGLAAIAQKAFPFVKTSYPWKITTVSHFKVRWFELRSKVPINP